MELKLFGPHTPEISPGSEFEVAATEAMEGREKEAKSPYRDYKRGERNEE